MGGLVIVQPLLPRIWAPSPPASARCERSETCVRLYSQPVWPSTPVRVLRQVSVPAYFPATPRPTTFQPPERVLEAESPRNTIVQLETPVKIRVARRKSIEPPTLLRRGEAVKQLELKAKEEFRASERRQAERQRLEAERAQKHEVLRQKSEQRRESLAEDLRRLAEEKRRVRHEEAQEVERKRQEAQRARLEAANRRLQRKLLLLEEKHRLAEEARRVIEEERRRRSEPGPRTARGRRRSGVERPPKVALTRSKSADAAQQCEAERRKAEQERLRLEEEEAERQRLRREQLLRLATESKRRISVAGCAWHEVLDVPPEASLCAVKQAFRDLALLHHPDKGLESCDETFRIVRGAYQRALASLQPGTSP